MLNIAHTLCFCIAIASCSSFVGVAAQDNLEIDCFKDLGIDPIDTSQPPITFADVVQLVPAADREKPIDLVCTTVRLTGRVDDNLAGLPNLESL